MFDDVKIRDFLTSAVPAERVYAAMQSEARVRWVNYDGQEAEGTVRHWFWTRDGLRDNDVTWKDAHVRITLRSGFDRYVSFEDLTQYLANSMLVFD